MRLEHWDAARRKFVLCHSQAEHSMDCQRYPFESIPRRMSLDTNVINRLVKWRVQVFDRDAIPPDTEETLALDVEALMRIFTVGERASWGLVGSPKTLGELARTRDPALRSKLLDYGTGEQAAAQGPTRGRAQARRKARRDPTLLRGALYVRCRARRSRTGPRERVRSYRHSADQARCDAHRVVPRHVSMLQGACNGACARRLRPRIPRSCSSSVRS